MPSIPVAFYQEQEGDAPVVEWLRELNATNSKAFDKCRAAIARLALLGHELRRPEADYLRDGIYELRVRVGSVNYRLLYFFSWTNSFHHSPRPHQESRRARYRHQTRNHPQSSICFQSDRSHFQRSN
jgi:phage-related protein